MHRILLGLGRIDVPSRTGRTEIRFPLSLIASTVAQGILLMTAQWLSNGRSPVRKGGAHQDLISGDVAAEP
jgi:hypothetical protein